MLQPRTMFRHVTPWLVSGASGAYAIQRARRLSLAEANDMPFHQFLAKQSDVVLLMVGSHVVWHIVTRNRIANGEAATGVQTAPLAGLPDETLIHQLRQVFAALTLGTGLLMRRLANGRTADIEVLAARLHKIVNDGSQILAVFDGTALLSKLAHERAAVNWRADSNGHTREYGGHP